MQNKIKTYNRIAAILIFIGMPVLFWALRDVARRSNLKETISLITLVSFSLMLMQFFLARSNKAVIKEHKMSRIVNWHRYLGYFFLTVLLVHPFLIVVPRYYEAGIAPIDAFIQMLTTFDNPGIILGIVAWCLMLFLGLTSLFRKLIPLSYKIWRLIHGIVSLLFITAASWHVIKLGRHIDTAMTIFILIAAGIGELLLLKTYLFPTPKTTPK
ncbi:ferric reductase-like transmembrane domain-containing protein [uncultured Draconibacterium sp.]|uniref:ferric reductase-like transmembrane domain-containing protein n=1 Tax=uncultured Draconibacterium sp. TaxID=1573823 RepID=UPI0029C842ED|nr:ferric reductase-like transmembrane domain-containing protein [uncultured Draconibacterium sp.]